MKSLTSRWMVWLSVVGVIWGYMLLVPAKAHADQIEMTNGDRYVGRVVSLGPDSLIVESEVLGTLKLPKSRISTITFLPAVSIQGSNGVKSLPILRSNNLAKASVSARTNASLSLAATMRQLSDNSNVVQQVQEQLLGGAGPEAQAKFNDLLGGLLSGKLDMTDLRAEAKSTLAQAKNARKELGEENGGMLDSYLAILEGFLKETEPETPSTNDFPKQITPSAPRPLVGE